jgi:hypothetical protein
MTTNAETFAGWATEMFAEHARLEQHEPAAAALALAQAEQLAAAADRAAAREEANTVVGRRRQALTHRREAVTCFETALTETRPMVASYYWEKGMEHHERAYVLDQASAPPEWTLYFVQTLNRRAAQTAATALVVTR